MQSFYVGCEIPQKDLAFLLAMWASLAHDIQNKVWWQKVIYLDSDYASKCDPGLFLSIQC